tara:strand:- start:890 stop:1456 length:567 start_codon:yes stop_codon:yes gene_type:complete
VYRHNGGIKGKKRTASQGGMLSGAKGVIRGRSNGGFMGVEMRSADLQDNINKLSGIWPLHGTKFTPNGASVTTTSTVDNSYYRQDPPYQAFQETSRSRLGGGYKWNVSMDLAACGTVQWPQGPYGGLGSLSNLQRVWTKVGTQGCDGWTFDVVTVGGYYYMVYPDPVYVQQFDEVTTTTQYNVWDWFG